MKGLIEWLKARKEKKEGNELLVGRRKGKK